MVRLTTVKHSAKTKASNPKPSEKQQETGRHSLVDDSAALLHGLFKPAAQTHLLMNWGGGQRSGVCVGGLLSRVGEVPTCMLNKGGLHGSAVSFAAGAPLSESRLFGGWGAF